jgi:hypothetical protein
MVERERNLRQIDRLITSQTLHGSESLCKLLRYLASHAIEHPGVPVKEYRIATEVFGRPENFDPQVDSTIRVQAGRLRVKLTEYYAGEGAEDPVVVEMPKGQYLLTFHPRPAAAKNHDHGDAGRLVDESPARSRSWMIATLTMGAILVLAAVTIAWLLASRKASASAGAPSAEASDNASIAALQHFWKPFVASKEEPWVIFSNAAFVGRPEVGMRYYDSKRDARDVIFDHYTGVGEVLAVHDLDQVFAEQNRQIRVKRGSLFSLDDAKSNNLIFVGSPSENLTLQEIPGTKEFMFQREDSGPRKGDLALVNVHPQAGEAQKYFASPSGVAFTEDYAVVALMPGLNPSQYVLVLAGTTTFGTQGAVEYVCRDANVAELLLRLSTSATGDVKPFEAVLHEKVERGVPVSTELVAIRERKP